jgi:Protein of unknown function (DUF1194)
MMTSCKARSWQKFGLIFALLALVLFMAIPLSAHAKGGTEEVDLELVLAVDVSYSMDIEEQRLQREGYVQAITSPEVIKAITAGQVGRIAITYFEWAGAQFQRVIVPWQIIDSADSARAFAAQVSAAPITRWYRTSISGALLFGRDLISKNAYTSARQVIDVSGDGPNNHGVDVEEARDRVLDDGIVINGLPVVINSGRRSTFDLDHLADYYVDCVIGGPGSFMVSITTRDQFLEATRAKILREIAGLPGPVRHAANPKVIRVNSERPDRPKQNCRIGEQMWRDRYRN